MQDDGNLVIYYSGSQVLWATGRYPDKVGAVPSRGYIGDAVPPIAIPLTTVDLGLGHYLQTSVNMDLSRRVTGHTVLTSTNKLLGFTGNVALGFYSQDNAILGWSL